MQRFSLESSERNTTDDTTRKQIEQDNTLEEEAAFPESRNFTRERIPTHTHYDSSPLTFGRHEEPMRNLFCTRNKEVETRRKICQSAAICRIFLGGKLARSLAKLELEHKRNHVVLAGPQQCRAAPFGRCIQDTVNE